MAGSRAERLARRTASTATAPPGNLRGRPHGSATPARHVDPKPHVEHPEDNNDGHAEDDLGEEEASSLHPSRDRAASSLGRLRPARQLRFSWRRSCCGTVPCRRLTRPGSIASPSSSAPLASPCLLRLVRLSPLRMWGTWRTALLPHPLTKPCPLRLHHNLLRQRLLPATTALRRTHHRRMTAKSWIEPLRTPA